MPTNVRTMGEGNSQAKSRVVKIFWDQHKAQGYGEGRPWWAYCEKQVDGSDAAPVGELAPIAADMTLGDGTFVKGWNAPWLPEQKYIQLAVSGMSGNRFRIDYARMRREYEEASRTYYGKVNAAAFAASWEPIELYAPVPFQLQSAKVEGAPLGAPPKSPKIPEAAMAGDRWLLGFAKEENEMLRAILDADNKSVSNTKYYGEKMWRNEPQPVSSLASLAAESDLSEADIASVLQAMKKAKKSKATQTTAEEAA